MVNVIVLRQTVYIQAALDHLAAGGHKIDPADVHRLSPLGHPTSTFRVATGPPVERLPAGCGRCGRPRDAGPGNPETSASQVRRR